MDNQKMDPLDFQLENQKKQKRCQAKSIGKGIIKELQVRKKKSDS